MNGKTDAVISEAVLGKVIGADLFAAVARADHSLALLGQGLLLLLHLDFVEPRTQHAHTFFAVFDLRFFILAAHDRIGGKVRDADSRVSSIHRLATGSGRTEGVDAEVFGFNLDVDVFSFG